MTLSRRYLEEGQMRALYVGAVAEDRALTDEQLSASLTATLAKKPKGAGARAGIVHGLHRRFCLRSLASRGTPTQPGLVLALEPGGACQGVVYRLPSPLALDELHLLWRREMVVAAYHPRWIQVQSGDRRITALTFVVRRDHVQYARLSHEEETVVIAEACGAFGSSCDYLMRTRAALASHGIVDRYLEQLARDVQRRQLACAAPVVGDVK